MGKGKHVFTIILAVIIFLTQCGCVRTEGESLSKEERIERVLRVAKIAEIVALILEAIFLTILLLAGKKVSLLIIIFILQLIVTYITR